MPALSRQQGPASRSFVSQRLRLHYADWGNPDAPLLVMLHGARDHCRTWDWVAHELRSDWHIIAPDLRGHGDSSWSPEGNYEMMAFVYDLSQLLHHLGQEQPTIVAHSLGANIALRFTGLYPDLVERLVAVEGLGPSPAIQAERAAISAAERHRRWIVNKRAAAGRTPKRYATFGDALRRMRAENANLSEAQARHLTIHGVNRNEDGTWSWKFDNYFNILPFRDLDYRDIEALWNEVTCPTLLVHGSLSSTPNPAITGRINHFRNARMVEIENAGHWLYNDQPGQFLQVLKEFLGGGNASGSAGDLPRVRASADIEASLTGSAR